MVVLFGFTYALKPAPAHQSTGYPSTYSSDWDGAKAAFTLLQNSGYQAERWNMPPQELPSGSAHVTLILAEPTESSSGSDRDAIMQFASAGGRLLVTGVTGGVF